jgi:methylphosphotriester-DNA--protein-cysteine methyltransferase
MSDLGNLPREFETWFFKEWGMTPHSFSEVHGTGDVKRCLRLWGLQQVKIDELKTRLNSMERRYIQIKQEHNELIKHDTRVDQKCKSAEKTAEKYKSKVSMIAGLLRDSTDQDMTLKAIQSVIDRVGEHE